MLRYIVLALNLASISSAYISIPLGRTSVLSDSARARESTSLKYGWTNLTLNKRAIVSEPLGDDVLDTGYFLGLAVGTPPVEYTLRVDTGSTAMLLSSIGLVTQIPVHLYDPSASSTALNLHVPFESRFFDGSGVNGNVYSDIVSTGKLSLRQNISAFNVAIPQASGASLISTGVDGLLGFAPMNTQGEHGNSYIENLFLANQLDTAEFGFAFGTQLTRGADVYSTAVSGGYFTIGGVNASLYVGEMIYEPICAVASPGQYWSLPIGGIKVDGKFAVTPTTACVTLDSGTSYAFLTPDLAATLYAAIPGAKIRPGNMSYSFPCDASGPNLILGFELGFTFGNKTYNLDPVDLISFAGFDNAAKTRCIGSIQVGSDNILGDIFLKNVYSTYRLAPIASIGLANLFNDTQSILETNVVPVSNGTIFPLGIIATSVQFPIPSASMSSSSSSSSVTSTPRSTAVVSSSTSSPIVKSAGWVVEASSCALSIAIFVGILIA